MESDDASDEGSQERSEFEKWAIKAFTSLQERQLRHTNRLMAMEAVVEVLLARVPAPTLEVLLKDLEAANDRIAEKIPPADQEPDLWKLWPRAIEAHLQRLRMPPIDPGLQTGLWGGASRQKPEPPTPAS
ncbi:hypothetical protein [Variovorax atrisoli]|uniref:hypothetical protein n=1 Tax=Variovorax atrisoli TaxID=3394203 RepID=UPI000378D04B|nr:hypothetical protein [Variovorax paradoxus]